MHGDHLAAVDAVYGRVGLRQGEHVLEYFRVSGEDAAMKAIGGGGVMSDQNNIAVVEPRLKNIQLRTSKGKPYTPGRVERLVVAS